MCIRDRFKAFLFSAIAGSDILVQPFTIVYTDVYGKEITTDSSKNIYWNDDTPLIKHGLRMLASGPISVSYTHLTLPTSDLV